MPPLVAQAFWPLSTHSSLASSYLAVVRIAETSEPASGSEAQKAATLGSSGVPKHCGIHSPICSGVPCPKIAATASEVPDDRHADAGVAPEELLVGDRQRQAGLVGPELAERLRSCRGRSWRPPGSPARASPRARPTPTAAGPDDALGEAVHPLADVLLVLVQLEGEPRLPSLPGAESPAASATMSSAVVVGDVGGSSWRECYMRPMSSSRGDGRPCQSGAQTSRRSKARRPSAPSSAQSKKRRLTQS